jgi:hypothetical protein
MAKRDGSPDPVAEAFRRLSEDTQARREVGTPLGDQLIKWTAAALGVLVLTLICLGIPALFTAA